MARRQPRPFCGLNRATEGEAGTQGGISIPGGSRCRPGIEYTRIGAWLGKQPRLSFEPILINASQKRVFRGCSSKCFEIQLIFSSQKRFWVPGDEVDENAGAPGAASKASWRPWLRSHRV